MDLIDLLGMMCTKIGVAFTTMMIGVMTWFEESMRVPLHDLGMPFPLQTVAIVLVPALSVVVIVRWMRGIKRFVLVSVLASMFVHASWPLVESLWV